MVSVQLDQDALVNGAIHTPCRLLRGIFSFNYLCSYKSITMNTTCNINQKMGIRHSAAVVREIFALTQLMLATSPMHPVQ